MKEKSNAIILMFIIITSMFIISPAQSTSSKIIITATGNPATTYVNPSVPLGWPDGASCTEDVYNIVNAVLDDNIDTIYLQNGPNGEPFFFAGGSPYVWVTKPKSIVGLDDRVPNDGSEVPTHFLATVPATKIEQADSIRFVPAFWIGLGGEVTIRNIWFDTNGGLRRWGSFILPPDTTLDGDISVEDNVFVTKKYGLAIWEIDCGLNIINNYINVQGFAVGPNLDESYTAIMVWCERPIHGTEDDVNVIGNYIKYQKAHWAVEFGGTTYRSKKTIIVDNTFTGSTSTNWYWFFGDANLRLISGEGEYTVARNRFIDIDSPDGCALMLRGVKNSKIYNNEFKNLQLGELGDVGSGAIFLEFFPLGEPHNSNNMIIANDFRESGLLGWDESDPSKVGCILLSEYAEDNLVVENLFPEGTLASDQIIDEGLNNIIVGRFKGGH